MTFPRSQSKRQVPASRCPECASLRGMNRQWHQSREIAIRSWCRICGKPVLLKISADYERAVIMAHRLDDSAMDHEDHAEVGGWGVHWRLDDVLHTAFPNRHWDELFPVPAWYPFRIDMDLPVRRIPREEEYLAEKRFIGEKQARLIVELNRLPQSRELLELQGPVWNEEEVNISFERLGSSAPFVLVRRRSDGVVGKLLFQREPRLYFGFSVDRIL